MRPGSTTATDGRGLAITALYEVTLLAGRPRQLRLRLEPDLAREDVVEIDGGHWTVADVRTTDSGSVQLICIHAE